MIVWHACTMEPSWLIRWMECHPGTAGYVQALSVIFTVAGAVFWKPIVSLWAGCRASVDLRRRTRRFALDLESAVGELEDAARCILVELKGGGEPPSELNRSNYAIHISAQLDPSIRKTVADVDWQKINFIFDLADRVYVYNSWLNLQAIGFDEASQRNFATALIEELDPIWRQAVDALNRIEELESD